jgi:antitoxin VapB
MLKGDAVALQIANPTVVSKVERLASLAGLSKTRAVERAVDAMLAASAPTEGTRARMEAILHQIDAIPDLPTAAEDVLVWDEDGLPL